ncbi:MAG: sodium:solute symporter family protein [Planctomycetota bacterium]
MRFLGLHILDVAILAAYVAFVLWLGVRVARRIGGTEDFFIAGRRLGKLYQLFLSFGTATDANQAVAVSREIYRRGIGGMWIQYLVLFLTPFYWFTTMLYRRLRLVTLGDMYTERFRSPFLGGAYALFTIVMAIVGGGASYMVAGKTMQALTPKPEAEYTAAEAESVALFREYRALRERGVVDLTPAEQTRYEELADREKRGELRSFVSYFDLETFYLAFALVVALYTVLGGFTAAAITDGIQSVLIVAFSVMLIPAGLARIGGFTGLHAKVPDFMFALFGAEATSEYAWFSILALVVANLISIVAVAPMMAAASAATDEMAARVGTLAGMFGKRIVMLFWALTGLLAVGLYAGDLHDPDQIWGYMTNDLLGPGAVGLMLVGVLAAVMSTLDAQSVTCSALFIRNLYQPLRPGRSERHCVFAGRLVILAVLFGGVAAAVIVDDLLDLTKYFIALPSIFGASIWLAFLWRRLTKGAVIVQVVLCLAVYAVIPNLFPALESVRRNPALLAETAPRAVEILTGALEEDVAAGRAARIGESIRKERRLEPAGIFFEDVVRVDPADPGSPREGRGRFHAEVWVLSWFGLDFTSWTSAELMAARFYFTAFFPFLLLFVASAFTKPVDRLRLDRFYGKLHTPVQPTPEMDAAAVERAALHPELSAERRLLPGTSWEIRKPGSADWIGFGASWLAVLAVLGLLWLVATVGA